MLPSLWFYAHVAVPSQCRAETELRSRFWVAWEGRRQPHYGTLGKQQGGKAGMALSGMRGLSTFISDVRNCQNKEAERSRVDKELANIRTKFKNEKVSARAFEFFFCVGYGVRSCGEGVCGGVFCDLETMESRMWGFEYLGIPSLIWRRNVGHGVGLGWSSCCERSRGGDPAFTEIFRVRMHDMEYSGLAVRVNIWRAFFHNYGGHTDYFCNIFPLAEAYSAWFVWSRTVGVEDVRVWVPRRPVVNLKTKCRSWGGSVWD